MFNTRELEKAAALGIRKGRLTSYAVLGIIDSYGKEETVEQETVKDKSVEKESIEKEEIENTHLMPFGGAAPIINSSKIGRNEPCPCGSGKKYKKCCLRK